MGRHRIIRSEQEIADMRAARLAYLREYTRKRYWTKKGLPVPALVGPQSRRTGRVISWHDRAPMTMMIKLASLDYAGLCHGVVPDWSILNTTRSAEQRAADRQRLWLRLCFGTPFHPDYIPPQTVAHERLGMPYAKIKRGHTKKFIQLLRELEGKTKQEA